MPASNGSVRALEIPPALVQDFMARMLGLLAEHFCGETTINHLRIGNYLGLRTLFQGSHTTNKEIARSLGIPASTVSRIVTELIQRGDVSE